MRPPEARWPTASSSGSTPATRQRQALHQRQPRAERNDVRSVGSNRAAGTAGHVEKTSGTATAGPVYIDRAVLRTVE